MAVVIPCFNDGDLVEKAVASVQEDEPVEIVVIDDGSTDADTLAALQRLEDAGTLVLRQVNAGPSVARMKGVHATSAPYIFPLDADDLMEPRALAALADALDANDAAAFAFGDYRIFGEDNVRIHMPPWCPWSVMFKDLWVTSLLYRRRDLLAVGGWSFFIGYENWDLLMAFAEAGYDGVRIDEVTFQRRIQGRRRNAASRSRHGELYRMLVTRHEGLFAREAEIRRRASPPLWKRVAYPRLLGARPLPALVYFTASKAKRRFYALQERGSRSRA